MFIILILFAGILVGRILQKQGKLIKTADNLLLGTVYFLLFLMGFGIGSDPQIVAIFPSLGFKALILSVGAVICCSLLANFFARHILQNKDNEK
jgi:uncharacterized transporter YbjL